MGKQVSKKKKRKKKARPGKSQSAPPEEGDDADESEENEERGDILALLGGGSKPTADGGVAGKAGASNTSPFSSGGKTGASGPGGASDTKAGSATGGGAGGRPVTGGRAADGKGGAEAGGTGGVSKAGTRGRPGAGGGASGAGGGGSGAGGGGSGVAGGGTGARGAGSGPGKGGSGARGGGSGAGGGGSGAGGGGLGAGGGGSGAGGGGSGAGGGGSGAGGAGSGLSASGADGSAAGGRGSRADGSEADASGARSAGSSAAAAMGRGSSLDGADMSGADGAGGHGSKAEDGAHSLIGGRDSGADASGAGTPGAGGISGRGSSAASGSRADGADDTADAFQIAKTDDNGKISRQSDTSGAHSRAANSGAHESLTGMSSTVKIFGTPPPGYQDTNIVEESMGVVVENGRKVSKMDISVHSIRSKVNDDTVQDLSEALENDRGQTSGGGVHSLQTVSETEGELDESHLLKDMPDSQPMRAKQSMDLGNTPGKRSKAADSRGMVTVSLSVSSHKGSITSEISVSVKNSTRSSHGKPQSGLDVSVTSATEEPESMHESADPLPTEMPQNDTVEVLEVEAEQNVVDTVEEEPKISVRNSRTTASSSLQQRVSATKEESGETLIAATAADLPENSETQPLIQNAVISEETKEAKGPGEEVLMTSGPERVSTVPPVAAPVEEKRGVEWTDLNPVDESNHTKEIKRMSTDSAHDSAQPAAVNPPPRVSEPAPETSVNIVASIRSSEVSVHSESTVTVGAASTQLLKGDLSPSVAEPPEMLEPSPVRQGEVSAVLSDRPSSTLESVSGQTKTASEHVRSQSEPAGRRPGRKRRKHKITVDVDISFNTCGKSSVSSHGGSRNVNSCLGGPLYTENSDNFVSIVVRRQDKELFSREKSLEISDPDDFHTGLPVDSPVDISFSRDSIRQESADCSDNRMSLHVRYTPSPVQKMREPSPVVKQVAASNQLFVSIVDNNPPVNIAVCSPKFRPVEEPISLKVPSNVTPEVNAGRGLSAEAVSDCNIPGSFDFNTANLQEDTSATMEIVEETLHRKLGRAQRIAKIVNEVELTEGERVVEAARAENGELGPRNRHVAKVITDVNVVAKRARIVREEDREMKIHTILYDINKTLQIRPVNGDQDGTGKKPRENKEGNNANESTIQASGCDPGNPYTGTLKSHVQWNKHCSTPGEPTLVVYERKGNGSRGQSTTNAYKVNHRKETSSHTARQQGNQNSTIQNSIWDSRTSALDTGVKRIRQARLRKPSITHFGKFIEKHNLNRYRSSSAFSYELADRKMSEKAAVGCPLRAARPKPQPPPLNPERPVMADVQARLLPATKLLKVTLLRQGRLRAMGQGLDIDDPSLPDAAVRSYMSRLSSHMSRIRGYICTSAYLDQSNKNGHFPLRTGRSNTTGRS
ncbi:hypothetical protein SprV_0200974600 [Sparganum proliferum]